MQYDVNFRKDFIDEFGIGAEHGKNRWHIQGGPWHPFAVIRNDQICYPAEACLGCSGMNAEVAGLSKFAPGQRGEIVRLVERVVPRESPTILMRAEARDWLAKDLVRPSTSDWSCAPVIVKKHDGSNRMCIDLRPDNRVTKVYAYPMSGTDSVLDRLRGAKYISKIDL